MRPSQAASEQACLRVGAPLPARHVVRHRSLALCLKPDPQSPYLRRRCGPSADEQEAAPSKTDPELSCTSDVRGDTGVLPPDLRWIPERASENLSEHFRRPSSRSLL